MEQPKQSKKLPGFYIALSCCVIAIGVAGFISQKMEDKSTSTAAVNDAEKEAFATQTINEDAAADFTQTEKTSFEEAAAVITSPPEEQTAEEKPEEVAAEYTVDNPDVEAASVTVNEENSYVSPIAEGATILEGFSDGTPIYNEYYGDWRTHNGIDIAADIGCSVHIVSDGTISEVGENSLGKYVKAEHDNGIVTCYAELSDINVSQGDKLLAGEVIGTIGESKGENVKESHLHFEVIKDGSYVNPESYK